MTNPTRINPVTVANAAENERLAPISPTGTPLLSQSLVRWAALVVTVAGAVLTLPVAVPGLVLPGLVVAGCTVVVTLGTALGIVSQGARK